MTICIVLKTNWHVSLQIFSAPDSLADQPLYAR